MGIHHTYVLKKKMLKLTNINNAEHIYDP